ncbi:MAG: flippase-like domain-containing protein [Methanotrichaceae archaeon]
MLISIAISIVTIAAVLRYTSNTATLAAISRADLKFVIIAVVLHIFFWIFWAIRLQYLTSLVTNRVSFGIAIKATLAGNFLSAITPASAGGEPMRVKVLNDGGVSCGCGTAVIIAERLLDSFFFLVALLILLALSDFTRGFGLQVSAVFLVIFILTLVFLWALLNVPDRIEGLMSWLRRRFGGGTIIDFIEREIWVFREAGLELANCALAQIPAMLALTFLVWIVEFAVPSVLLMGLGYNPSFLYSITSQLIIILIAGIPLTPGSSGVVELSMSYLYSMFVPSYLLGVLVLVWRIITYFTNLVVGAPFAGASIQCKR